MAASLHIISLSVLYGIVIAYHLNHHISILQCNNFHIEIIVVARPISRSQSNRESILKPLYFLHIDIMSH